MPIGIIGSLAVCTILYVLFAHVLTGIVNYKDFNGDASPVATVIALFPYDMLAADHDRDRHHRRIHVGDSGDAAGPSRVFFSMSRDGLLPKVFSDIHPKFRTPWRCNLIFMVFVSLFSGFLPISIPGPHDQHRHAAGVCDRVRRHHCDAADASRRAAALPHAAGPLVPILGVLVCFAMMASLDVIPGSGWWSGWLSD